MPRVPLLGGAYRSRAIIASSQRCINLYPEINEDEQAPTPVTHFPTPGLVIRGVPPAPNIARCIYRASNGNLFAVVGSNVYYIDANYNYTLLGAIPLKITPCVMKDNGRVVILVTGTLNQGWAIRLSDHAFAPITAPNFFGGVFVDYVDTFFILNVPGENEWYFSLSNVTYDNLMGVITPGSIYAAFDPLDYTAKTGSADPVASLIVMHRNIWTLGTLTTEVWYNSGAADFTFAALPGVFVEHGIIAVYSLATYDLSIYWLTQDRQGRCLVFKGDASFQVGEISTKGIEAIFSAFPIVSDAIGGCYQVLGHAYYVITFPSAGRSFACELKTHDWHELAYTGPNGLERHRAQGWAFAYGRNLTLDRQDGTLYELDPKAFTDAGRPITRLRTIPHLLNDGKRIRLDRVIADMQGGTLAGTVHGPFSQSIQTIIRNLGLETSSLQVLLEAGNLPSWSGPSPVNRWLDETGHSYNFYLGINGGMAPDDPIFNGTLGGQSMNEFWSFSGAQYFTYDDLNEAWMERVHRNGAKFTLAAFILISDVSVVSSICGDLGALAADTGFKWWLTGGNLELLVGNAGATVLSATIPAPTPGSWHLLTVTVDEAAGTGFFGVDGVYTDFVSTYAVPAAGNATFTMQIGASGNNIALLPAGSGIGWFIAWEGMTLTKTQITALQSYVTANNQLPSPLTEAPKMFLRVSYDRGGSWSDYLEGQLGAAGEYGEMPWWPNLGLARDFVLEVSWSAPMDTALNGIFYEATPVGS